MRDRSEIGPHIEIPDLPNLAEVIPERYYPRSAVEGLIVVASSFLGLMINVGGLRLSEEFVKRISPANISLVDLTFNPSVYSYNGMGGLIAGGVIGFMIARATRTS